MVSWQPKAIPWIVKMFENKSRRRPPVAWKRGGSIGMRGGLTLLSKLVCKTSKKLTPGCPSSGSMMPPGGLGGGPSRPWDFGCLWTAFSYCIGEFPELLRGRGWNRSCFSARSHLGALFLFNTNFIKISEPEQVGGCRGNCEWAKGWGEAGT